jgi:hypothetical protein
MGLELIKSYLPLRWAIRESDLPIFGSYTWCRTVYSPLLVASVAPAKSNQYPSYPTELSGPFTLSPGLSIQPSLNAGPDE